MSAPLQYTPLNKDIGEIRLLVLLPSKHDEPVQLQLLESPLHKDSVPNHEVLSYVWGSTDGSKKIIMEPGHSLTMTKTSLRSLTLPSL